MKAERNATFPRPLVIVDHVGDMPPRVPEAAVIPTLRDQIAIMMGASRRKKKRGRPTDFDRMVAALEVLERAGVNLRSHERSSAALTIAEWIEAGEPDLD